MVGLNFNSEVSYGQSRKKCTVRLQSGGTTEKLLPYCPSLIPNDATVIHDWVSRKAKG